jgi:hypothetical protein
MYMKKKWGFRSPCGPLVFSNRGSRDGARNRLKPDDIVVIVGTKSNDTEEESERGMILGLMEPSDVPVSSLDFSLGDSPRHLDANGVYRWPYGLELRKAWRFDPPLRPFLSVCDRLNNMQGISDIVELTDSEEAEIWGLSKQEIPILQSAMAATRVHGQAEARRRSTPPPSTTRRGVMHMRRANAFTYAMRLHGASGGALKIGWSFDWRARERKFNHSALPDLGGIRYHTILKHEWDTATNAFLMEQKVLNHFELNRSRFNIEIITRVDEDELNRVWADKILEVMNKDRG